MKKVTNNILKGMASRFSATVMLLAMGCIAAFAQGTNKLYIEDFDIAPGETKTLDIILDNEDPVSSLQFDILFPKGLTYVEGSLEKVTSRITRSSHSIMAVKKGDVEGAYRMGFISTSSAMSNSSVKGNEGALLRLQVKADYNYTGSYILMSGIIGSNGTVSPSVRLDMENCYVTAGVHVGDLNVDYDQIIVRPLDMAQLAVNFDNVIDVVGMQFNVTLPEGVNFVEDEQGEFITYSDRLSGNVTASVAPNPEVKNQYTVIISSLTSDVFEGETGTLFALNLAGNKNFTTGNVVISDVIVSSKWGIAYPLDSKVEVELTCVSDPTGDGVWNIFDVTAVLTAIMNLSDDPACDVNNDGKVNVFDYTATLSKVHAANK